MKKILLLISIIFSFPVCAASYDYYQSKLKIINSLIDENFDFYLTQDDNLTGSYIANSNTELHYIGGCGGNSGMFLVFSDFEDTPNLLHVGTTACVQSVEQEDMNKDGNNELIVYSRSGGSGYSVNFMNIINYFDDEVNDIEIRIKEGGSMCANFMFPRSQREEIFKRLNIGECDSYYSDTNSVEMKTNANEIDIIKSTSISFDYPILLEEFIKLNPSYPNGECSYAFGKIILGDKIELIEFPEECLIN